jgi:hypothetical protein
MRSWQAILTILILAFFALSSGWHVLYILTYVMLSLFVLSWLWALYSVRRLVFHRSSGMGRIQVGEMFEERLMLDNLSSLPKLWVQIADGSTLPGHRAGYVASMGGRKRALWRARSLCRQRGRFQLGPVTATSGDPFGLFRRRIVLSEMQNILVLPRVLPITQFALFTGGLPGRGRSARRALQTTTNANGRLIFLHRPRRLNLCMQPTKADPPVRRGGWARGNPRSPGRFVAEVCGGGLEKSAQGTTRAESGDAKHATWADPSGRARGACDPVSWL